MKRIRGDAFSILQTKYPYLVPIYRYVIHNDQEGALTLILDLISSDNPPYTLFDGLRFLGTNQYGLVVNSPLEVQIAKHHTEAFNILMMFCCTMGLFGFSSVMFPAHVYTDAITNTSIPFGVYVCGMTLFSMQLFNQGVSLMRQCVEMGYLGGFIGMMQNITHLDFRKCPSLDGGARDAITGILSLSLLTNTSPIELIDRQYVPDISDIYSAVTFDEIPMNQLRYFMQLVPKSYYEETKTFLLVHTRANLIVLPKDVKHLILSFINTEKKK